MEKGTKTVIWVVLGLVVTGGVVTTALIARKRKKEKENLLKILQEQKEMSKQELADLENKLNAASEAEKAQLTEDLLTQIDDNVVGKMAYPAGTWVNVRTSPYVNNGWVNNLIYEKYNKNPFYNSKFTIIIIFIICYCIIRAY